MSLAFLIISADPFDSRVVYQRVFNTIKLFMQKTAQTYFPCQRPDVRKKIKKQSYDDKHTQPDSRVQKRREREAMGEHKAHNGTAF